MSVELRIDDTDSSVYCDWGIIEHGQPRPERDEVGHLMLTTEDYIQKLLEDPRPLPAQGGALHQMTRKDGRLFAHVHYYGKSWTWELFPAHWWDEADRLSTHPLYIGRWPD